MKRKFFGMMTLLIAASIGLAACTPPPPLKSDKYLNDTSIISGTPCAVPCFQGITVGTTTFSAAVTTLKGNQLFSNVQTQDSPPQADWSTAAGEACCQMTADAKGVVNALLFKLAPNVTAGQLIDKFGEPQYVTSVDYSPTEVALALIFPKPGLVAWVTPGDATSTLQKDNPVVVALYLDPNNFDNLLATATLQGWGGFLPYHTYQTASPMVTPRVTATPSG